MISIQILSGQNSKSVLFHKSLTLIRSKRFSKSLLIKLGITVFLVRKPSSVAKKYLKQSNLWEKRSERARMLSGGMKRRLMIARALMHEPKLLILDEPTAGVDIELRREMWTFLRELNESGTTIILTTHYLEEAEMLCRNIGIIQSGELIENTSMKSLLSKLQFETFIFDLEPYEEAFEITGYNHVFEDKQNFVCRSGT